VEQRDAEKSQGPPFFVWEGAIAGDFEGDAAEYIAGPRTEFWD
jgi:hypothetical protein